MKEASISFSQYLKDHVTLQAPSLPIISNVSAKPVNYLFIWLIDWLIDLLFSLIFKKEQDTERIKLLLSKHLIMPVLWYQSIQTCIQQLGVTNLIEIGPVSNLGSLALHSKVNKSMSESSILTRFDLMWFN